MKQRETNLMSIVSQQYGLSNISKLEHTVLSNDHYHELMNIYKSLGGKLKEAPIRFGSWDIVTENFIIELDEEQHFNRYRKQTLESPFYVSYKWFDVKKYSAYCAVFENICLKKAKHGGYWENESTVKQFGPAGENGVLSGNGSPRWKQRAFYDFCRDMYAKANNFPVYRFSIYDEINLGGQIIELGTALLQNRKEAVLTFLNSKIKV